MNQQRRLVALAAAFSLVLPVQAIAQAGYPVKPIHFVVPFSAGGESDIVARRVANQLTALRGYTVIVDNYPGAGGDLGTERALREGRDGYTFLVISGAYAANAAYAHPGVDPLAAIQPVVQFTSQPTVLVSSLKYTSVKQLFDRARESSGGVTYGTAGIGSLGHLINEDLAQVAGVRFTHIPYKGTSGAVTDLAGGQIDMLTSGVTAARALARGGKIRLLAVTSAERLPELPDVPTLTESGIPFVSGLWHGLVASKSAPPAVVEKLNKDLNAVLKEPALLERFKEEMLTPIGGSPQQFRAVIAKEVDRLQNVVRSANIKP